MAESPVVRAVVFDFDGLILDTEVPVYRSWAQVYADHGEELALATWQAIIGTDSFDAAAALEARLGRRLDWDDLHERRRRLRDELQALEEVRPGVLAWLSSATEMGLSIGIASSSDREWVVGHLERLGLVDRFACIRCRDDVGVSKPDPASYAAVVEWFGCDPDQAVAVEDSPHGVAAAKGAGLWCVAVPGELTRGLDFSAADLVLRSLAEVALPAALARLGTARNH